MSRTLSINGIGKMDTASWSVYFNDLKGPTIVRGAKQVSAPSISADKGTVQDIKVNLSNPKDEISYTVDIVNDGTIDAEITMIKDIELTDAQKKVFEFKVTYTDTGEVLKNGDLLPKKTTKNITINIKFKDDITEFDLPTESQTINLSYQITYTQYDGSGVIVGPNGGTTTEKAVLAGNNMEEFMSSEDPSTYPFFNCTAITRSQVESITFLNSNIVPTGYEDYSWDASQNKDGTIMAWYEPSETEGLNKVYIGGNGGVYAPSDSSLLFGLFVSLKELNFNNNFDTSEVNSMFAMFIGCRLLTSLELSSINITNIANMSSMFNGCSSLTSLDLSSFNATNIQDMSYMFQDCSSLISLDLSSFDTTNVTNINYMFNNCIKLSVIKFNRAEFNKINTGPYSVFGNITDLTVYVKDESVKDYILKMKGDANVIIEPLSS